MAWGTRAGQGAHPLALLGVGHAPPLQHQLEVLCRGVASRGQPLEPADGGQLGQRPELLPQHVLQHLSGRDAQESGRCVHGGEPRGRVGGPARPFIARTWGLTRHGGGAWTTCRCSAAADASRLMPVGSGSQEDWPLGIRVSAAPQVILVNTGLQIDSN